MGPGQAALTAHSANYIAGLAGRLTLYPLPVQPTHYDEKGRQTQYVESALQRRERIAFLKKRECARRVAIWMHQTGFVDSKTPPRRDHYFKPVCWQTTDQHDTENEPYIIYSSSPLPPRTPLAPVQPVLPSPPPSPCTPPTRTLPRLAQTRVTPASTRRRRTISLSSISELPEED